MKTSEEYIQQLAKEFDLPVEKVALVWSTAKFVVSDFCNTPSVENMYDYVGDLLVYLFPKQTSRRLPFIELSVIINVQEKYYED